MRWVGRCGECQTWGSVVESGAPKLASVRSSVPRSKAVPIASVDADAATRVLTGVGELDRVLGAGLVPGAVVLLAGEPGVGQVHVAPGGRQPVGQGRSLARCT